MVRRGLRLVLDAEPDLRVVAEAGDGAEALELARDERARPGDPRRVDAAHDRPAGGRASSRALRPELRVLMLSMHDNEQYLFEALKAGASGYVLKSAADRDLVEACRAALRGEPFLYPSAIAALIRDFLDRARDGEAAPADPLTPRELRGGQAGRRGAHERRRSPQRAADQPARRSSATARTCWPSSGMRDRVELTRYAIRRGLVEP